MNVYSASALVAQCLPWPTATIHCADRAAILVRDLKHDFEIQIPYSSLTSPTAAACLIAETLRDYRLLIDAWYGRYPIIWS